MKTFAGGKDIVKQKLEICVKHWNESLVTGVQTLSEWPQSVLAEISSRKN